MAGAERGADGHAVFCDFIELVNPVFETVRGFVAENSLSIQELWLWRAGSSAIKKAVVCDRDGVMGGAVEDKALHDFSISVGLLGPGQISWVELVRTEGAQTICASPASIFRKTVGRFLVAQMRAFLLIEWTYLGDIPFPRTLAPKLNLTGN